MRDKKVIREEITEARQGEHRAQGEQSACEGTVRHASEGEDSARGLSDRPTVGDIGLPGRKT